MGSNGHLIGKMLAEKLNIAFYDKELINIASEKSGLHREFFEKADEKTSHSLTGGLFGLRSSVLDEIGSGNYLGNENLFEIQSEVIRDISRKHSAVFIGRCADYILKDEKMTLSIYIHADMPGRIKNVSENLKLSEKESLSYIQKSDKQRSAYYNFYTSKEWGKAESYDLCINSSLLGLEETVNYIYQLIHLKFCNF